MSKVFALRQANSDGTSFVVSYHQTERGAGRAAKDICLGWSKILGGSFAHDRNEGSWTWTGDKHSGRSAIMRVEPIEIED